MLKCRIEFRTIDDMIFDLKCFLHIFNLVTIIGALRFLVQDFIGIESFSAQIQCVCLVFYQIVFAVGH